MLTRRALIIFNLGMAVVFLVIGGLSTYALNLTHSPHQQSAARLIDPSTVQALKDEDDIERTRARALYYLQLAYDIQQTRYEETDQKYYDARLLSFFVAAAFLIGTIMLGFWRPVDHSKPPPKT